MILYPRGAIFCEAQKSKGTGQDYIQKVNFRAVVTMPTGLWLLGAIIWPNDLCWRKQLFINRVPTLGVLRALLLWVLLSHETQNSFCSLKGYKPKPCPEVLHFLICPWASQANRSLSSLECALVSFRATIFLQVLSLSGSGGHNSRSLCSGPETMCCATLDHSDPEAATQGGTHPHVGPWLQSCAPIHTGSKPLMGPLLKEWILHTTHPSRTRVRKPFQPLLFKDPPEIPHVQEANGCPVSPTVRQRPLYFCQLPSVFDPISAAIFSQGKSFPTMHLLHTCICSSSVGHPLLQLMQALYELPPNPRLCQLARSHSKLYLCLQFACLLLQPLL